MHLFTGRALYRFLLASAVAVLCCSLTWAAEDTPQPDAAPPSIAAVTVDAPPVIDGLLDDACWQQATHIEGFWRETVDAPELERTEAWICCDRQAVYAAFRCHDSRPLEIRCDQRKRQGTMERDDRVEFYLDAEDQGRSFYTFCVNPVGTQLDRVPGGSSDKIEWRGDWRASAHIDESGWEAEMAIPFSILRYPEGQDCFRFYFERHLAREEDRSLWPVSYARVSDGDNCARWSGVATPAVPFRYVLMPYLLSVASENEAERETLTGGLDFKATLPNGLVGLATYKPDFHNLEDVVETIDFTFVERHLPEYRPFFQEGSGYLPSAGVELFYSRRIRELEWGAKTFGTVGSHRFYLLDAAGGGGENHLVMNYEQLLGTEGLIHLSGVDRRVPGDSGNLAYGLGTYWNWQFPGGKRSLGISRYQSRTDGEGGDDAAVSVRANARPEQGWGGWAGYNSVGSQFRADDGYVPETGVRNVSVGLSHHRTYSVGAVQRTESCTGFEAGESEVGPRRRVSASHSRYWRTGWSVWAGACGGERDRFDVRIRGVSIGWNRQDMYRAGGFGYTWGERYGEPYRYQRVTQAFHPSEHWSAELRAERVYGADLDDEGNVVPPEWSHQLMFTSSYDISDERTISARLVRGGSDTNMYAAYRQRVRRGMDLLIVVGDPNANQWVSRIAAKAMWCL